MMQLVCLRRNVNKFSCPEGPLVFRQLSGNALQRYVVNPVRCKAINTLKYRYVRQSYYCFYIRKDPGSKLEKMILL